MINFEAIQAVNKQLKLLPIEKKGKVKEYVEVNQRIKAFRMLFPNGAIETEIVKLDGELVVMKATVKDEFGHVLGTGTAYEKENSSFINQTSFIENCETSAVGRALAMCGFGIDVSVASFNEVKNAMEQSVEMEKIDEAKVNTLLACIPKHNQTVDNVCKAFNVSKLSELNVGQFIWLMNRMGE